MDGNGQAENPVPQGDIRNEIAEKRVERRANEIIKGISQAHYIDDKASLFAKRLSPRDINISAKVAEREKFDQAVQKMVGEYQAAPNSPDPLKDGTLSLNFTDEKMIALAGVGRHLIHPEPYAFTMYFSNRESLHSFLNWLTEDPNVALTQVFERLMVRQGQAGKPYEDASYFSQVDKSVEDVPYTESHPFIHNKISSVNVKRDRFDKVETITPPLGKPYIQDQHS